MTLTTAEGYVEITQVHVCIKHSQQCSLEELHGGWLGRMWAGCCETENPAHVCCKVSLGGCCEIHLKEEHIQKEGKLAYVRRQAS